MSKIGGLEPLRGELPEFEVAMASLDAHQANVELDSEDAVSIETAITEPQSVNDCKRGALR